MSELAQRLRELRREAGMPAPTATARSPVPEELRRLLGIRAKRTAIPPTPMDIDRDVPGEEIAPGLRYTEQSFAWDARPAAIDARFAGHGDIACERLLHFDTETTGLAGGTGTRAFMIGAADWRQDRLRVRQLTMTRMAAEAAMLNTFAGWIDDATVLVSYNGKSYDAPLLNTRYCLERMPSPLRHCLHLDLLHPARRRWRGMWENCRLATIERHVLGVVREDDLPGSEAPRAWLDYLRGGSARNLRRVALHNSQDLRSLAGLCLRLSGHT